LYGLFETSNFSTASSGFKNQWVFRHFALNLPLIRQNMLRRPTNGSSPHVRGTGKVLRTSSTLVRFIPAWGDRDVREITRRDVRDLLDAVADTGRMTTANRLRLYLSGFFAWCVDREVIEANPVAGVKAVAKEVRRDRVLSEAESDGSGRRVMR
jgi:integrase